MPLYLPNLSIFPPKIPNARGFSPLGASVTFNLLSTFFDGTNDDVGLGSNNADLAPDLSANEFTVSAWFNVASTASQRYIVAHATPFTSPANMNYVLAVQNNGHVFGYFGSGSNKSVEGSTSISIGTWYHGVLTVRQIGGFYTGSVWLNAVSQGNVPAPGNQTTPGIPVRIGAAYVLNNPNQALPFSGSIDEVSFWNVGFTSADVAELYNGGAPFDVRNHSKNANLIHYYRMGDGDTYPVVNDLVGTATGTCENMAGASNFTSNVP